HDGISRFSHSLIHAVAQQLRPTVIIHDPNQRELLPESVDVVTLHKPTSLIEPIAAYKLNAFEPDVVFSPMQTIGSAGRNFGLILTLHDLIFISIGLHPETCHRSCGDYGTCTTAL